MVWTVWPIESGSSLLNEEIQTPGKFFMQQTHRHPRFSMYSRRGRV